MNSKISAIELKNNFLNSFNKEKSFTYEDGNPFLITFERNEYYVFLKNISPAYYPKYPDITRVQLPYSPHFNEISKSNIPFIILGYNAEYETFTGWDPSKIKARLNNRSNVSLFSRDSFQEKLRLNDFREHHISNGDKVIVFSKKSIPIYFKSYLSLFTKHTDKISGLEKNMFQFKLFNDKEKLKNIEDKNLLKNIKKLLKNKQILEAVNLCAIHFQDDYPEMELKDWFDLVDKYH